MTFQALRLENDYVINHLKLVSHDGKEYDMSTHRLSITFEESVFLSTIHGSVTFSDAVDYYTLLPIIGEERIRCSFTRQDENSPPDSPTLLPPLEFDCPVYKISPFEPGTTSNKIKFYTLYFCSDEFIKNLQNKVFKGFKSTLFSQMAKTIYEDKMKVTKDIEIEETKFEQDWTVSNSSPVMAIKKIADRSISPTNKTNYFFYEDREKFHYVSADFLIQKPPVKKILWRVLNVFKNQGGDHNDRTIEQDINSALHYHHAKGFDIIESLNKGKGASRLITIDLVRQKIETKDFDLDREFDAFSHLERGKHYTPNSKLINVPESCIKLVSTNKDHDILEHIVSRDPGIKPTRVEEYFQYKKSFQEQILRNVITITLSGDPRVKAGDIIEFDLPEMLGKVSEEFPQELDKYLQGRYLVFAVMHVIKNNAYSINLEIVKDTFFQDIKSRDPVAIYEGTY